MALGKFGFGFGFGLGFCFAGLTGEEDKLKLGCEVVVGSDDLGGGEVVMDKVVPGFGAFLRVVGKFGAGKV